MANEFKEKYYHRGILMIFLEIFKQPSYCTTMEYFIKYLELLRLIAKENNVLHENEKIAYTFVVDQFNLFIDRMDIDIIIMILKYLLNTALETEFDPNTNFNKKHHVYDQGAINAYFQILVKCFKCLNDESNIYLKDYVISPLESLTNSFMNNSILADILVQELLMKILKRSRDKEFQKQLSRQMGTINSTSTSVKHLQSLMRGLIKKSKYVKKESEEDYFRILLDTLIDCISGNSIRDVYFFSGNTNSFIELNSPLTFALPLYL